MRSVPFLSLLLLLAACADAPRSGELMPNHGDSAKELSALERLSGEGPFVEGATEHFRAVVNTTQVTQVRWSSTAGALEASGTEASWTLPSAGFASLTVTLTLADGRSVDGRWAFQVLERPRPGHTSAREALLATPMPVLDGGTIEVSGGSCDIAYDSSSNVHIGFTTGTHPGLYYGKWNGSAWTLEYVDGMGFNTGGSIDPSRMSMVVTPSGTPHFAYISDDRVFYASKSGGNWIHERVDSASVPLTSISTSYHVGLALNPAASGRPTVIYERTSNNYARIAVAERVGTNSWTQTPVTYPVHTTSIWSQYLRGQPQFDAAGTLFFPAVFTGSGGTNPSGSYLASWTTSTTDFLSLNTTIQPLNISWSDSTWAGTNRLLIRTGVSVVDVAIASPLSTGSSTISNVEVGSEPTGDIAWGQGKPTLLHQHGSVLELVTTDANGYWTYTQLGTSNGSSAALALHPTTGVASICYQNANRIMFQ